MMGSEPRHERGGPARSRRDAAPQLARRRDTGHNFERASGHRQSRRGDPHAIRDRLQRRGARAPPVPEPVTPARRRVTFAAFPGITMEVRLPPTPDAVRPDAARAVMIYGATGYTGQLVARLASTYGIRPIVAGRNAAAVAALARSNGLRQRTFQLDDDADVQANLAGVHVVLHCAGPFAHTARAMAEACIARRVHYLDVAGEIDVFEAHHARDAAARAAGVMLLPGVGFDVVPTDCLAARLKARLPTATRLMLGLQGSGRFSRGTMRTMAEHTAGGGAVRRGGRIVPVPAAYREREIDFGDGPRAALTIPWGDVSTAYYTTGIGDIEVYARVPRLARIALRASRSAGWLLRSGWLRALQARRIDAAPPGPGAEELVRGRAVVWGRVEDDAGNAAEGRIHGPNAYLLTAHTALLALRRVIDGDVHPGFQTPAGAYGADFVLDVPDTERVDVHF
jgi:short subunit dehydrogenase-like uncharacterized protein